MKFGPVSIRKSVGGVLAHSIREGALVLKKGTVITQEHVEALFVAGIAEVTVAVLSRGDLSENEAARQIASSAIDREVVAEEPFTGRVNLFAASAGVLHVNAARIDAVNALDESVTIATLADRVSVEAGEMVATVKIIPFAVPGALVKEAIAAAESAIGVSAYSAKQVAVFSTLLPGLKSSVVDKTLRVFDERLSKLGSSKRLCDIRVHHTVDDLSEVLPRARALGADVVVVFGASAITDRRDVIPAALEGAGGKVIHLGMPVDPGNLLMLGEIDGLPVIGAPGCARSPKENGFDWVLQRLIADLKVTSQDIRKMGVGGLLMEIVSRPQPRDPVAVSAPEVAAILLAAGQGTRMGGGKMTAHLGGKALVRHAAEAVEAVGFPAFITVVGHDAANVSEALAGVETSLVNNPDYATGMSSSLKAGIAAVPETAGAVLVMLGDMPSVTPAIIKRLLDAFSGHPEALAIVPTVAGQRGNPVLLSRKLFGEIAKLKGDAGARKLLDAVGEGVIEVSIDDAAVLLDVDTSEALAAL
ncbi:MAG: NTP transferase domain-containing protein [Beijerinckiaceae bacterium]